MQEYKAKLDWFLENASDSDLRAAPNSHRMMLMDRACKNGDLALVKKLQAFGYEANSDHMMTAQYNLNEEVVAHFEKQGLKKKSYPWLSTKAEEQQAFNIKLASLSV